MLRRFRVSLLVAALVVTVLPPITAHASTSPPGAPTGVKAAAGTLSATVSWTVSGAPADSYTVVSSPGGISATVDGTATSATVSGLGFLISYTFSVTGTNSSGTGSASVPSNAVTPLPPGGPYHQGVSLVLLNANVSAGHPVATNFGDDPVHLPGLSAVVLNVTASQGSVATSVQLVVNQQIVQAIGFGPGQVESSLVVIPVPAQLTQAAIQVAAGTAHVEMDFVGYFTGPASVRDHSGLLQMIRNTTLFNTSMATGATTDIPVLGQGEIPSGHVAGVLLNVTAINATGAGSFALRPTGSVATGITTIGFAAGETTANRAIVALPSGGSITIVDRGAAAGVRVDVLGWFTDATDATAIGSLYSSLTSVRLVDTAAHGGPLAAGGSVTFPVWGQGGSPGVSATAPPTSALVQVTAISPSGAGSIAIAGASVVDFAAGQTVSGVDLVHLAGDGSASLTVLGAASNVTVDLVSYFSGDLIVPGSTKVLSAGLLAAITNLGSDLSITFAAGAQVSPPIRLNDVIAAGVSPTTPNGFLRRVLSITTNSSGQTILGTRIAKIPEAVTAFSVEWVMPPKGGLFAASSSVAPRTLTPAAPPMSTSPFPPPLGTSIDPNWPSFFIAKPPKRIVVDLSTVGLGASELDINDLEIQALPHFKAWGNPFAGQTLHLSVGFSVAARAAIQLQLLATANLVDAVLFELPAPIEIVPNTDVQLGPVPVVIGVDANLKVTFTVRINGGIDLDLNVDRYGAVSGGFNGSTFFVDQPVYQDYLTPQQAAKIVPDVQEQAEFDVHLMPEITIYGGIGAMGVDVRPYLRATVAPLSIPWWEVSAGICRSLFMALDLIFFSSTAEFPPVCVEIVLFSAPGAKLVVTISPTSATVPRSTATQPSTAHFRAGVAGSNNGVTWSIKEGSAGGSLSVPILGGQTDVDYTAPTRAGTYHVIAAAIDDPTSTGTVVVTVPVNAPTPPQNVSAVLAGTTSATVTWGAPADDGGAALTGYQVAISPGSTTINTNATTLAATFQGLNPNTAYTFTVTATNSASLTSAPSAAASITTPPSGPMSITPTTIDFGPVTLGQTSSPQTVTIVAGGTPLIVSSLALSGTQPGDFAIQSDLCTTSVLLPGGACTFAVVYKPTAQGSVSSAAVTITDSDPTSPQQVILAGSSPVPTTHAVESIGDIQVLDSQRGYLLEGGGLGRPSVMATADGGNTWNFQTMPLDVKVDPTTLHFVDATHGWVNACRPISPAPSCPDLLVGTSDGGQTWHDLALLPNHLAAQRLWFTDATHGWVLGGLPAGPTPTGASFGPAANGLYTTADGGLTWTPQTLPDPAPADCGLELEGNTGLSFADSLHGWVMGEYLCWGSTAPYAVITQRGVVSWTTSDAGLTWTANVLPQSILAVGTRPRVVSPTQIRMEGALQIDPNNTIQVLLSSDDGGVTFTTSGQLPGPVGIPHDIQFIDPSNGFMIGSDNELWRTSDAGSTWVLLGTPPPFQIPGAIGVKFTYSHVDAIDPNNIWIVGNVQYFANNAIHFPGIVRHSSDGGATWTTQLLGDGA